MAKGVIGKGMAREFERKNEFFSFYL